MSYEQKDNSGSLFRNDKQGVEKRPDYTGKGKVNGAEVRISAWLKESKNGGKYLSLSFQEPRPREDKPAPAEDFDDALPF